MLDRYQAFPALWEDMEDGADDCNNNECRNGKPLRVVLDRYQTFHALGEDKDADFTGAHVTSDKPISVFSGNKKVGKRYFIVSLAHRIIYWVIIDQSDPNAVKYLYCYPKQNSIM